MQNQPFPALKLGILGGGQLGRMLLNECMKWGIETYILDPDPNCSCAAWTANFIQGDFRNYDDVLHFGQKVSLLTVEIEQVNTDALMRLVELGVRVHPDPNALKTIQDKGLQKQCYAQNNIPTANFQLFDDAKSILAAYNAGQLILPFVQKTRLMGYDGKGVQVLHKPDDLLHLFDEPSVVEDCVAIKKELSIIVAQSNHETASFAPIEMVFHPKANLVDYLQCPADLPENTIKQAHYLAVKTLKVLAIQGVLAVEMFLDDKGQLLVNEVAPRPHNSGHFTIEAAMVSQYEQHLRSILSLPLGSTALKTPYALMLNLLGAPAHTGPAHYEGLTACMGLEGVNIHLYGKKQTRPFRKMGHVSIVGNTVDEVRKKANFVQNNLRVVAQN